MWVRHERVKCTEYLGCKINLILCSYYSILHFNKGKKKKTFSGKLANCKRYS